ncbi:MAG: IS3 family transposase [Deltaproteobacteria bacterium]|nr:IS3 family transposase [Deltaproteobacteria bacterium]
MTAGTTLLPRSFWRTIKAELIRGVDFPARAAAHQAISEYIEVTYTRRRRQSVFDHRTPAQQEEVPASAT